MDIRNPSNANSSGEFWNSRRLIGRLADYSGTYSMRVTVWIGLLCAAACWGQSVGGCPVLPARDVWNARVDSLPVHANSSNYVNRIGVSSPAHADFGAGLYQGGPIGIPYIVVPGSQPRVPVSFDYANESDPGPYPIPPGAPIEGGSPSSGDRHVLVIDSDHCFLYELFSSYPQPNGSWTAGSGAIYDLRSDVLRPSGWTSADAAGLPIFPGLVRYDEVAAGEIRHAIRFTAPRTQKAFVWPARHYASSLTDTTYPPMGVRFRLKASFDVTRFGPQLQVILRALQKYGMILADNGSSWFFSGVPDDRWDNDQLHQMGSLHGSDFEAIDESSLMLNPNSGEVKSAVSTTPPIGFVDLPTDQSTISGAIPVTGWALDTVQVENVKVFRDAVPGEAGYPDLVYIGDGVFVPGARPDVQQAFPTYPFNDRAGWGLQVLTNGLPASGSGTSNGNGRYRFHVVAYNTSGFSAEIGVKNVTVDNAHAMRPFGTIDTPGQGATISGTSYVNFGWVVTQQPNIVPVDGSTIWVYLDGVAVGHPVYNNFRPDIEAGFPGLRNSAGAVGYYIFDTTKMANGSHTIGWTATDSAGHVEGIGSRIFFVQN